MKRFFEQHPVFPKDLPNGEIRNQRITDILKRRIYAGIVEHKDWFVPPQKAVHKALISLETYQRIQERLTGNKKTAARKDISQDFVLRGAVVCNSCHKPLTANWSRSKVKETIWLLLVL